MQLNSILSEGQPDTFSTGLDIALSASLLPNAPETSTVTVEGTNSQHLSPILPTIITVTDTDTDTDPLGSINQRRIFNTTELTALPVQPPLTNPGNISHLPVCSCFAHQAINQANNPSNSTTPNNNQPQSSSTISANTTAWIGGLNSGYRWNFTGTGTPTITYSFFSGGTYYGSETGTASFSAAAQTFTRRIFTDIQSLINVNFTEVADSQNSYGQIRLLLSNNPSYAYAYYPFGGSTVASDVHFNPAYDNANNTNGLQKGIGSHGYMSIIHEIGHALGLKHPGDYNGDGSGDPPFLAYGDDNTGNTVMSYNFTGNSAATYMPLDILTLQSIYGARTTTNASNTTYTFTTLSNYNDGSKTWGDSNTSKLTIWDVGGTDTINFGSLASNSGGYRFDLNDGGWFSTRSGFNTQSYKARGDASGTTYYTTTTGTRLAYGASIENLIGSSSSDIIIGNGLNNAITGGAGNDSLDGGIGNDWLAAGDGLDTLFGGDDNDTLYGGMGSDSLNGGAGNDAFAGEDGNDTINGDAGDDAISGNAGDDILLGGAGNDFLVGGSENDSLNGGTGNDNLVGETGNDTLLGDSEDDYLDGGAGNDSLDGGIGNDWLAAGDGLDTLFGGDDNDTLYGGMGSDSLNGGAGNDAFAGEDGNDTINGDTGDDAISGNAGDDILLGGAGNDFLFGGSENDSLNGGAGNDNLVGETGNDTLLGDSEDDYLDGGAGNDSLDGGIGNDWLAAGDGLDTLLGGDGNDTLYGGMGSDSLNGGAGNDAFAGEDGNDTINGDAGDDAISGNAGDDILLGGAGNDLLVGGEGTDQFIFGSVNLPFANLGFDAIYDFEVGEILTLSKATFAALTSSIGGSLSSANEFAAVTNSVDTSTALIVYDRNTGALIYNQNGTMEGFGTGGYFAQISGAPSLTTANFRIVG
jgi:Ca2+-binding RTX toxin-like protein